MTEDFSNYPKSITEAKSAKSRNAADWTPRDVLIDVLRRLDSGEVKPDALTVCYREKEANGVTRTYYSSAGPDHHTTLGLLMHVQARILDPHNQ